MTDYNLRPITMQDAPQAAALWHRVFGDEEQTVLEFFRLFGHLPTFGICAEKDGQIAAAAYCPTGTDLLSSDSTVYKGAYLYAVATDPAHRKQGLAKAICLRLKEIAFANGCEYLFTKPSEDSLYPWYEEAIGAVPVLGCTRYTFTADIPSSMTFRPIGPAAYAQCREELLAGIAHVRQSDAWLTWEHTLHNQYGGSFYATEDWAADTFFDGQTLVINELIPPADESRAAEICGALMHLTGAADCTCTTAGSSERYVSCTGKSRPLPADNPWFGSCFG